jgi:Flp pilus assembly pilin Flp
MTRRLIKTLSDTTGQTMTEYAFILVLIVAVVLVVLPTFASTTVNFFTDFVAAFGS